VSVEAAAGVYARYFDELTTATTGDLRRLAAADMRFKDPFNDIRGVDRVVGLFDHMFQTTEQPRFVTGAIAVTSRTAFLRWRFTCTVPSRLLSLALAIEGVSEVRFDAAELVVEHVDYWDPAAAVYERLPLLGGVLRGLRRRLAHGP
jgi:hypothetical protein